jgi:hypothetical protein
MRRLTRSHVLVYKIFFSFQILEIENLEWAVVDIQRSAVDREIIMKLTVKQKCSQYEMNVYYC